VDRVPTVSSDRSLNVATPAVTSTLTVPARLAAPGLFEIITVTLPVNDASVLPSASRTWTVSGVIGRPAVAVAGWMTNASDDAVPAVTSNVSVSIEVRPAALATSV
jgi:hypothetical protein